MAEKPNIVRRQGWPMGSVRPVATPLSPSVVFATDTPDSLDALYEGRDQGWTYSREGHPNAAVLAGMIDALEGAEGGLMTGSGMAAVTAAILGCVDQGGHIVAGNQLYGRSLRLMAEQLPRMGISSTLVDPTDADAVAAAIRPETGLILVEVVSNPTIRVADMEGILRVAAESGVKVGTSAAGVVHESGRVGQTQVAPASTGPLSTGPVSRPPSVGGGGVVSAPASMGGIPESMPPGPELEEPQATRARQSAATRVFMSPPGQISSRSRNRSPCRAPAGTQAVSTTGPCSRADLIDPEDPRRRPRTPARR